MFLREGEGRRSEQLKGKELFALKECVLLFVFMEAIAWVSFQGILAMHTQELQEIEYFVLLLFHKP